MKFNKWVSLLLTVAFLLTTLIGCAPVTAQPEESTAPAESVAPEETSAPTDSANQASLKVAMLLSGTINDAGWNQSAYTGLVRAADEFGIETAYSESVQQPDFEAVMRDYADKGYDIIICHGNQFADAALLVGQEYPDSFFCVVNGNSAQEPNVSSFRFNTAETGFLAGTVAAMITKTGTVSYITGSSYPHMLDGMTAYEAGAKYINPDIKVLTGNIESFTDVAKAKEMALAFIEQGADVTCANADAAGLGVIDAAQSNGVKHIGYISDQYDVAPDTVFVSCIQSVEFLVYSIVKSGIEGTLQPVITLMGAAEGAISLSDFHGNDAKLPEGGKAKLDEIYNGILDGSLKKAGILPLSSFEK